MVVVSRSDSLISVCHIPFVISYGLLDVLQVVVFCGQATKHGNHYYFFIPPILFLQICEVCCARVGQKKIYWGNVSTIVLLQYF